ncbi:SusD/RagB family nutrient-binding outer membrane lipoprotein [Sphingobacterium hungaricum]|uniref:SusD/RagB family nutrient-binding outer membrane lipoprotein n=1 Tax=Sphingobacterium hungaricum TaxID=2082723 RepID=A0A928UYI2_9SPHI|nr:SusD/RagB family nutrient-binding outer membrane lipoprotein [Sphingobacterium hungaricum]MBE8713439.1 SusD/RagB family nutrient-binding outer membrane lipoprotein [Sphingobacterium hungaricum]
MKNILSKISIALLITGLSASCTKLEDINFDPTAANDQQVRPEYFLNNSIIGAQQDPHIAERMYVYYWKTAARHHSMNYINQGADDDGFNGDYWRYISEWLNNANSAIEVADIKATNGTAESYNENLKHVARIWRVYLMSELTDNFGPAPIESFKGVNPTFDSVKDVYYYMLAELADAPTKLDITISGDEVKAYDAAYGFEWDKWIRFANSMRMRLAMRLSEIDPAKAKTEFEAALVGNKFIESSAQNFSVQEKDGWDPLTGVMSRTWNTQILSATMNNIFVGLGGIKSADQFENPDIIAKVKEENDFGTRYFNNFSIKSNDPSQGYYLDGLPNKMDPRAYKAFFLPGNTSDPNYFPSATNQAATIKVSDTRTDNLDTKYTWNAFSGGTWGAKASTIVLRGQNGRQPGMVNKFRTSTQRRIFFASWESYFLIAEASLRGWATPLSDKAAYEKGIEENFAYWDVTNHLTAYKSSTEYNRVGTSVSYDHVTEPATSFTIKYKDAYTGVEGTSQVAYPSNTIYKNGAVKNDKLTKIITQKYIASFPYLALEAWSDHRRLGLPFFENPAIEQPIATMPQLTDGNYTKNQVNFFPQRLRYPSSFRIADQANYDLAVGLLGQNGDQIWTPLWWAKQN